MTFMLKLSLNQYKHQSCTDNYTFEKMEVFEDDVVLDILICSFVLKSKIKYGMINGGSLGLYLFIMVIVSV